MKLSITTIQKKTHRDRVHSSQVRHRRRPTKDKHRADDNVRCETEEHEDQVRYGTPAGGDDFEECVCVWGVELEFGSQLHHQSIKFRGGMSRVGVGVGVA